MGVACVKARRYVQRVYSPERVRHPLLRRKGRWKRVNWDVALDYVAENLANTIARKGHEAVLYYQGMGERTALKLLNSYFFHMLGGVTTTCGALCGGTGQASQNLDVGDRVSHDPLDHRNSNAMILWGRNPASTHVSLLSIVKEVRRRGPVVLVDPLHTPTLAVADRHIAPRPGSDAFLALAVAKTLKDRGAADMDFLERHTENHKAYLAILDGRRLDELCRACDVPVKDVEALADIFQKHMPVSILLGWGLHRHKDAHLAIRAIDALGALAGTLGIPGGGVSQGFEEYGPYDPAWWGEGISPSRRKFPLSRIGKEMATATPPVSMAVITASNPACSSPASREVARSLDMLDCVVLTGHFLNDTSDQATCFLPATTFLEEDDIVAGYGHNYVGGVNRAIDPIGECRSEFEIFQDLSRRFPDTENYRRPLASWLETICAPLIAMGCDLSSLRHRPFRMPFPMVPYAGGKFPTPSGKFRCLDSFDPTPLLQKDPDHPLTLLTTGGHRHLCSERSFDDHESLPEARLAPEVLAKAGIEDGATASLVNEGEALLVRVKAVPGQRQDVAMVPRGGWHMAMHGVNGLTPAETSVVGNGAPYYDARVALRPNVHAPLVFLMLENSRTAPGGVLHKWLERLGGVVHTLRPPAGEALPEDIEPYAGLVVLGGNQHAYDDAAFPCLEAQRRLMRTFVDRGRPVLGICLGCQLLAQAFGGEVYPMGRTEVGYVRLARTRGGESDPLLGSDTVPRLMEYHEDACRLPPEAVPLLTGGIAPQAFRIGKWAYGFQFHMEAEAETVARWMEEYRKDAAKAGNGGKRLVSQLRRLAVQMEHLPMLAQESSRFCYRSTHGFYMLAESAVYPYSE
jgi:anaerobic selenocysteine-containing dehydrogenase/GMP synthase-like glutamine amidotransferase